MMSPFLVPPFSRNLLLTNDDLHPKLPPQASLLFDVSHFNRIADKHNIPWIDRIPLIETVCWGSKGWLDSALVAKLRGRWNGYRRNGPYGAFMGEVMSALSATSLV